MNTQITLRAGLPADHETIVSLLEANHLPHADIDIAKIDFVVALSGTNLVGCAGIEVCGKHGLLRSFSVAAPFKNQGVGTLLFNAALLVAKTKQLGVLHLLTTSAQAYFSRFGFSIKPRKEAPVEITNTLEFSQVCPSTAVYMALTLQ